MAVNLQAVLESNARLSGVKRPLVALFVGATSGIGLGALREFARHAAEPRVYVVARDAAAGRAIVDELRALNPRGRYDVVEQDVSLVRAADEVAALVAAREPALDLLFLSVGFVSLDGRRDTAEGLDASMTTRYYSRLRLAQRLLPLLERAPRPRVVSVLAGGQEGALRDDDLSLSRDGGRHWSVAAASVHSTTMGTLAFERLAAAHPRVAFVHAYPGLVATPLLGRLSAGPVLGPLVRYLLAPLLRLFARSVEEAGQRALFLATSARYAVGSDDDDDDDDGGLVPLSPPLQRGARSNAGAGIFLVDADGAIADSEKVLAPLRKKGVDQKVWDHTQDVFSSL